MKETDLLNFFQRAIQPLKNRMYMLAGRAILTAINDGAKVQEVQLTALAGETLERVQRFQEFGFSSHPPVGTEAIMISLGGVRGNSVIVATDNRNVRVVNLASGETAIYTDDGTYIMLKKAGQVEVKAATLLTIDVPDTLIKGNVTIDENLLVKGETELQDTLLAKEVSTFEKAVTMQQTLGVTGIATFGANVNVTGVVGAAGFTGPGGGAAVLTVDLTTSGQITAANVTGGGTDLATVKSTFNAHTHVETGGTTNPTGTPL